MNDYCLVSGDRQDRPYLLDFLSRTYQEIFPEQQNFSHLSQTVDQYFSRRSPLWWAKVNASDTAPIAGLWLGNAVDQVTGQHYAHVFMLYVLPDYRRQGIATALLEEAQRWSQTRGDRQIGLQVFPQNTAALNLYQKLGFIPHSVMMLKRWS